MVDFFKIDKQFNFVGQFKVEIEDCASLYVDRKLLRL